MWRGGRRAPTLASGRPGGLGALRAGPLLDRAVCQALQEVALLLQDGLREQAGQALQADADGVQLLLQLADALVQLLATLL